MLLLKTVNFESVATEIIIRKLIAGLHHAFKTLIYLIINKTTTNGLAPFLSVFIFHGNSIITVLRCGKACPTNRIQFYFNVLRYFSIKTPKMCACVWYSNVLIYSINTVFGVDCFCSCVYLKKPKISTNNHHHIQCLSHFKMRVIVSME